MDKKDRANKRRQDKHHKKPPPSAAAKDKPGKKEPPAAPQQNSAPLIVYDDPYSRRPIEPNWSRDRDLPPASGLRDSSDEDDGQLLAADLEKLLQLPPSASGHFFLSTEKHWAAEDQQTIVSSSGQHFRIDSKQLNLCLGTIPFHERNGYPVDLFSKRELDSMTLKASFEAKKYQDYRSKQKMSGESTTPRVPAPCLIGPDALPPGEPPVEVRPPPPRPMPCLIGPMALPPELRHDPNVTGSWAAAAAVQVQEEVPVVVQQDVVPIGGDEVMPEETGSSTGKSKEDKEKENEAVKVPEAATAAASETKEDIQAWLDDILDS